MPTTKPCRLEHVLSVIIGQFLTQGNIVGNMDFIHYLYQKNPNKEKSIAECVDHLFKHFPEFESEEFEQELHDLYTLLSQTENKILLDSFTTYWFLQQIKKYGEVLLVPCLPRTNKA